MSTAAPESRRSLEFPDLLNARDLGGYPTTDGAHTRWRSLLRADDLSQLSELGLEALGDYGVRTILDLRWPEEAERYPSPVPARLPQLRYARISLLTHTEDEWRLRSRDAAQMFACNLGRGVEDQYQGGLPAGSFVIADNHFGAGAEVCKIGGERGANLPQCDRPKHILC